MPGLEDIVRTLDSLGSAALIGGRTLLPLDSNPVPAKWDHITKIDPEDEKQLPLCFPLYLAHTSAVSVGGSKDVTEQNTLETFEILDRVDVPAFNEPSDADHVTKEIRESADFQAIPEVLNGDSDALVGTLGKSVEYIVDDVAPALLAEKLPFPVDGRLEQRLSNFAASWLLAESVFEAYIIMNVDSAAASAANVGPDDLLTPSEAKQHAMAAEHHLKSELVYLEYSGTFGGEEAEEILEAIDEGLQWSRIWYGGGLDSRENAKRVLDAGADAVVVGNVFHEIAAEEVDICADAADALDADATRSDIEAWIDDHLDVAETSAAKYLATIPDVSKPTPRAREYILATIRLWLAIQPVVEQLDDEEPTTHREVRKALKTASIPGQHAIERMLDDEDLLLDVLSGLLAARYDIEGGDLPVAHVGLEL